MSQAKEKIVAKSKEKNDGVEYFYTTCVNNGCWDATCILKYGVKDNKVISIEADDTVNPNMPREDIGDELLKQGMVQQRACPMGHAWRQELEAENRVLYPLKRVGEKGPGKGHFERISWEEALDTIADQFKRIAEEYPNEPTIYNCMYSSFEQTDFPLYHWWPGALIGWGDHSVSGGAAEEEFHLGVRLTDILIKGTSDAFPGFEAPDLFNSKLIVLWGYDPVVTWFGSVPYYMKLAKERGCKIIAIDPCYNLSAEIMADQWIPIRPGTDAAFGLAVAYVLYTEDLYDHEYVEKWVEPNGFESWRKYVVGEKDGEPKSPEWAEDICAVPAETIRDFAHLYAASKPVHLHMMYSVSKRNLGDYATGVGMLLQAMTGNMSIAGGCEAGCCQGSYPHVFGPMLDWGRAPADVFMPTACNNNKVTEAMYCREKFDKGEMSEDEFRHRVGCPPGSPLPNLKMAIMSNNYVNNQHFAAKRMHGFAGLEFNWGWQWHMDQTSMDFLDIVLPAPIIQFETMDIHYFGINRYWNAPSGMANYFIFNRPGVKPPGEIRPKDWVWMEIAKRLGIAEKYNPKMMDVSWEDWDDQVIERIYKPAYEAWAADPWGLLKKVGFEPLPWEEFLKKPIVRVPIDEPHYPFKNVVEDGRSPFNTPSKKIEFESSIIKNTDLRDTKWGGLLEPYPVWQPSYQDLPANDSYYHPWTKDYPLSMITPVSTYRQHSCNDQNPWLRDDCYRHAVWINPADAADRGIKDGDRCVAYNQFGEVEIDAYVTSKIIPGTVSIHHGAWSYFDESRKTDKMEFGIDTAGNCNFLIGDTHLPHVVGALLTAGLVEVRKVGDKR